MSTPSSSSTSQTTRQNAKNSVILALTTLSIIAETIPIPGAKVPAVVLTELVKALEVNGNVTVWFGLLLTIFYPSKKMKVNKEALEELHQSLLELIGILDKTKVGPFVSEQLQQNVVRLFEYVTFTRKLLSPVP